MEAIRGGRATELLVSETARGQATREVVRAAEAARVPIRRVPRERLDRVHSGEHRGVVARVGLPSPLGEADLAARSWPEDALVVALDGVTDPHNVGAVARTVEAAGASALVLRRTRAAGPTSSAVRSSAGALLHLPVAEVPNVSRALRRLQNVGFWVMGLEAEGSRSIWEADPPKGKLAVVLGSEDKGMSRLVREACDEVAAIPLRGRVASLNVSVAAGIALFELTRVRGG